MVPSSLNSFLNALIPFIPCLSVSVAGRGYDWGLPGAWVVETATEALQLLLSHWSISQLTVLCLCFSVP